MPKSVSADFRLLALALCAGLLSGCQVTNSAGQYRTWLSSRAVYQPALIFERQRPAASPVPGGQCWGRTYLVNWEDRTFVDPRSLPVRPTITANATPGGAASQGIPPDQGGAQQPYLPTQTNDPGAASGTSSGTVPTPPSPDESPEPLPRRMDAPIENRERTDDKSVRNRASGPIEQAGREQSPNGGTPTRTMWNKFIHWSTTPIQEPKGTNPAGTRSPIKNGPVENGPELSPKAQSALTSAQGQRSKSAGLDTRATGQAESEAAAPSPETYAPGGTLLNKIWRRPKTTEKQPQGSQPSHPQEPADNGPELAPKTQTAMTSADGRTKRANAVEGGSADKVERASREQPADGTTPSWSLRNKLWPKKRVSDSKTPDAKTSDSTTPDRKSSGTLPADKRGPGLVMPDAAAPTPAVRASTPTSIFRPFGRTNTVFDDDEDDEEDIDAPDPG